MELTIALIRRLQYFQFKKTSKSDPVQFINLYTTWIEVYNHLKAVGQKFALNHDPTLNMVTKRLPGNTLRE